MPPPPASGIKAPGLRLGTHMILVPSMVNVTDKQTDYKHVLRVKYNGMVGHYKTHNYGYTTTQIW